MFCPQCGTENPDNAEFCRHCDARLSPDRPSAELPYGQTSAFAPRATSTLAIVSLVAGIASYVILPVVGGIVAIITGHMALNEINRSGGTIEGRGLAIAGLILGYVHIGISLLGLVLFLLFGVAWCGCLGSMGFCSSLGALVPTATPTPWGGGI